MQLSHLYQVCSALLLLNLTLLCSAQAPPNDEVMGGSLVAKGGLTARQVSDGTMTNNEKFKRAMLYGHYYFRRQHGASALAWNTNNAAKSSAYAAKCKFAHSVRSRLIDC